MMTSLCYMLSTIKLLKAIKPTGPATPIEEFSLKCKKMFFALSVAATIGLIIFFLKHRFLCHDMGEYVWADTSCDGYATYNQRPFIFFFPVSPLIILCFFILTLDEFMAWKFMRNSIKSRWKGKCLREVFQLRMFTLTAGFFTELTFFKIVKIVKIVQIVRI